MRLSNVLWILRPSDVSNAENCKKEKLFDEPQVDDKEDEDENLDVLVYANDTNGSKEAAVKNDETTENESVRAEAGNKNPGKNPDPNLIDDVPEPNLKNQHTLELSNEESKNINVVKTPVGLVDTQYSKDQTVRLFCAHFQSFVKSAIRFDASSELNVRILEKLSLTTTMSVPNALHVFDCLWLKVLKEVKNTSTSSNRNHIMTCEGVDNLIKFQSQWNYFLINDALREWRNAKDSGSIDAKLINDTELYSTLLLCASEI